jgi:hypothetical protein
VLTQSNGDLMDVKRKKALREYIVFRVKMMEFLDMATLRQEIAADKLVVNIPIPRTKQHFVDSLRTPLLSFFPLFVDKNGMNVIKLWKELFPAFGNQIDDGWSRIEPGLSTIRTFRNKAGFHADNPLAFFKARRQATRDNSALIALEEFKKLFSLTLHAEPTLLPDLEEALDDLLDELESQDPGHKYQRAKFKEYLMIPAHSPILNGH